MQSVRARARAQAHAEHEHIECLFFMDMLYNNVHDNEMHQLIVLSAVSVLCIASVLCIGLVYEVSQ